MTNSVFTLPLEWPHGAAPPLVEYVGDDANRLALVAWDDFFADTPAYNPLVFHGPTSVGKTMLAQGMAHRHKKLRPRDRVLTITGADFARKYVGAIETNTLTQRRVNYAAWNLLLLDNLHELAEKPGAQQELTHLVEVLLEHGRRVLVTSRQAPAELPAFLPQLASRLSAGLTVPMAPPGVAARREIARRLARGWGVELSAETQDLLADAALTAPELNSLLCQLHAQARQLQRAIDVDLVSRYLQERPSFRPSLQAITHRVAKYFQVKSNELRGPTRRQAVVRARGVAMHLARRLTDASYEQLGKHFGGRDHTTALHACRKTEELLQADGSLRQAVEELASTLAAASRG